jgi:hypothetical protein
MLETDLVLPRRISQIEMNQLNETLFCGCIACAAQGHREEGGTYLVNMKEKHKIAKQLCGIDADNQ